MPYNPKIHHRHSIRLKEYDYTQAGACFITLCTYQKHPLLGKISGAEVQRSEFGEIAAFYWQRIPHHFKNVCLGEWIVMPNHIHGILLIAEKGEASACRLPEKTEAITADASPLRAHGTQASSLGAIIQNYKSVTARKTNLERGSPGPPVWQRNYWEHIIRNEQDYNEISSYITNNPHRWQEDSLYTAPHFQSQR